MKAADGPTLTEKACSKCKEVKPKSQFCINKYMQDGMQVRPAPCADTLRGMALIEAANLMFTVCHDCFAEPVQNLCEGWPQES